MPFNSGSPSCRDKISHVESPCGRSQNTAKLNAALQGANRKGPHTRTVLPSVLTAQAKLCQVCSVWPARGFTTHAQLNLKEIDQFSL